MNNEADESGLPHAGAGGTEFLVTLKPHSAAGNSE